MHKQISSGLKLTFPNLYILSDEVTIRLVTVFQPQTPVILMPIYKFFFYHRSKTIKQLRDEKAADWDECLSHIRDLGLEILTK